MSIYPGDPGDPVTSVTVTYERLYLRRRFLCRRRADRARHDLRAGVRGGRGRKRFHPTEGEPGLTAPDGTAYTINNGGVEADAGSVALLFDGIINNNGTDRTDLLWNKALTALDPVTAGSEYAYEFKYLDLVDRDNGNVWVKASEAVTVYWPLPEGADAETLKVLHFKGLHREMASDDVESEIEDCDVEEIEGVTVTGAHVVFEIGEAGFSPFALVWRRRPTRRLSSRRRRMTSQTTSCRRCSTGTTTSPM